MSPKRPAAAAAAAAAASGSASDASDAEGDASRPQHRRRRSPSPTRSSRSRSRSKTPPLPNPHPNAAAFAMTPASGAAVAVSDSDGDGRAQSPRSSPRGRSPRPRSDSDADAGAGDRSPSPRRSDRGRSPRLHSDSDADAGAGGRSPSPRRHRERSPSVRSDSDAAAAGSEDDGAAAAAGNALPPPRSRRSSRIETSNIKPISTRVRDAGRRDAGDSSQQRSRRPHSSRARHSPEQHKRPPRVWSPEDEITILRALIAYRGKKGGLLPGSIQEIGIIHDQIRGQLTSNASTTQLSDKVRRLKHKYKQIASRVRNGRDPDLPTAHDREFYELSKKVWGKGGAETAIVVGGSHAYETAGDAESNEEQESGESDDDMEGGWYDHERTNKKLKAFRFDNGYGDAIATGGRSSHGDGGGGDDAEKQMYPYLWEAVEDLSKEHPSGSIFRKAFGVLGKSKARAMEDKLRKFRMSEIRQQLRRMDLMKETVAMVLDALEGAD
ncbi:hypothetical protein ACP4OV_017808 [Aristida adscensionis]